MRAPLDRRVAVAVLVAAGAAVVTLVLTTNASHDDRGPRDELLELARKRERASWLVTFDFRRTLTDGRHLAQRITEANRPPVHVVASGTAVTVDFGDRVASCTTTAEGPRCIEEAEDPSVASSTVYREVLRLGAYRLAGEAERTIAGEGAQCFTLVARGRAWPQLGARTEQCYARDGVPLRSVITRGGSTDTRVAVRVARRVSAPTLAALVGRLEREQRDANG